MHPVLVELGATPAQIMSLSITEQEEILKLVDAYDHQIEIEKCRTSFYAFMRKMWHVVEGNPYIEGRHHKLIAESLDKAAEGKLKRIIFALPPRHTKSVMISKLFPAYVIGRNASNKIIQACNVKGLADQFGAAVRSVLLSPEYQEIFPDTKLDVSSTAKGDWATTKSGKYFAVGVGGTMTGQGGNFVILDDLHDEREAVIGLVRPEIYDATYAWYKSGPRQRLQPQGCIIVVMTRWSRRDLTGQLVAEDKDGEWTVVEFPAILPSGKPLWPEFWSLEELTKVKDNIGAMRWNAQYMQQPTSVELSMIKPTDWRPWTEPGERKDPPRCTFTVQSWDTAHSAKKHANPSACTTWGVT